MSAIAKKKMKKVSGLDVRSNMAEAQDRSIEWKDDIHLTSFKERPSYVSQSEFKEIRNIGLHENGASRVRMEP